MSKLGTLAEYSPELAAEWHPTKNGELTPEQVSAGSNIRVWWRCKYGHEWQVKINSRTSTANGCPVCSGHIAMPGFNDLATIHPELVAEWHFTKNGDLTPKQVTCGSGKKVWWQCSEGHEWQATIHSRTGTHSGCPVCSGRMVVSGFNDLATMRPELIAEWHPIRNNGLKPEQVKPGSQIKVWWRCGKGHEWNAAVASRSRGAGCPYCTGQRVLSGINDLDTVFPALAAQWHPYKNGDLLPSDVRPFSGKKVWWQCAKGHEFIAVIANRSRGNGCPICRRNANTTPDDTI